MARFALLGSVFLPTSTFEPLARVLTALGHDVRIAATDHATSSDDALGAYRAVLGDRDDPRETVVVAHSNAGTYVPALVEAGNVGSAVFMDAVLPGPDGASQPTVRLDLAEALRPLITDGALPRWTEWWPRDDVLGLFPDERGFAEVHEASPRVAAGYLDDVVEVPRGWPAGLRAGYLAFGDAYADERRAAESLGWPVRTLDLGHLGHFEQPPSVARELLAFIDRWRDPRLR